MTNPEVASVFGKIDSTFRVLSLALDMMASHHGGQKDMGLRNVLILGRSVTFILQNLRGKVEDFERFYEPIESRLRQSELMGFFKDARNHLEKRGDVPRSVMVKIDRLDPMSFEKLTHSRPPDATRYFIGDALGGSGWEIPSPDGDYIKLYVELPETVGSVQVMSGGELLDKYPSIKGRELHELAQEYVDNLRDIVHEARKCFLGDDQYQQKPSVKGRSHLRVIK